MSGTNQHPHVPNDPHFQTPFQYRQGHPFAEIAAIPIDIDNNSPPHQMPLTLRDIDIHNGVIPDPSLAAAAAAATPAANMQVLGDATTLTVEQQLEQFRLLAERQQNQLQNYEAQRAAQNEQWQQAQATVAQLSQALAALTANTAASVQPPPPPQRKKPEMPPWDPKRINIWIRRLNAAYQRANVTLAKDKFAFLESTFDVAANPKINEFLYGNNTDEDWDSFLDYLRLEYGKTIRQKSELLIKEYPRQGLTPTQYLSQMNEDTTGVTIDNIKREHLLKSLLSRIRELLGKEVEQLTAAQVAEKADSYFDRQGNLLERHSSGINAVDSTTNSSFTAAFNDTDDDDSVNHIRRGAAAAGNRSSRSKSRPPNNRNQQNGSRPRSSSRQAKLVDGLCHFHRKFGDEAYVCRDGCKKQHLVKKAGNAKGGRRQ